MNERIREMAIKITGHFNGFPVRDEDYIDVEEIEVMLRNFVNRNRKETQMATVKEAFSELRVQMANVKKHLADAHEEQKVKPTMKVPELVYSASYSLMDDIPDFIIRACESIIARSEPEPEIPVVDPTKRVQIGPTLAVIDHPDKHVRIMMEEAE